MFSDATMRYFEECRWHTEECDKTAHKRMKYPYAGYDYDSDDMARACICGTTHIRSLANQMKLCCSRNHEPGMRNWAVDDGTIIIQSKTTDQELIEMKALYKKYLDKHKNWWV